MKTAEELIKKMGKKEFTKFVANSQKNGKTGYEKDRGIKGRIKHRRCQHGVWIIDNYEPKPCNECMDLPKDTKIREFKPTFNIGLGCYVESRSEEKRIAKSMGLEEAG